MTFNQFAAASISDLPTEARFAFEAVWEAMVGTPCSTSDAFYLLTDLAHSIPRQDRDDDEDDYE